MKKKILFIIWSNSYGGGAESQLTNLVNNLDKNKYDIDVIEYFHTDTKPEILSSHIINLSPIIDNTCDSKFKKEIVNYLVHKYPWIIRKIYIRKKYDLQISFNYLIPTFLLDQKTPAISWIHTHIWDIEEKKEPWLNRLQRNSFKHVDKIVAIAKETKKSIDTIYPEYKDKTMLIYNGYDFDRMEKLSNEKIKIKNTGKFEILYCNRFDDNKNPVLLVEAAKLLKERTNNFHISMLGKGELEQNILELIKKYNLQDNITIIGYVQNPYPYIKNADIMALTSKAEGFSTVIIEGLYFNKPYVSTNGGVTEEIIEYGPGIVANTKKEISDAMYKLMNDNKLYKKLSTKCKEIASKYSLKNQVKETEKLIDSLIK